LVANRVCARSSHWGSRENVFYSEGMDADALGHPVIDADNHYYEAEDAFTRHLDPALGPRCVQWATIDGKRYHVLGGRVSRAVSNATFDPVSKPGCLYDYFRGNAAGVNPLERLRDHEPIRPEYRDADARLHTLDDQGLAGCWLFPTLGMIYEEPLRHDPEAVCHTFRAFNRWLRDDWGFVHADRIFVAPTSRWPTRSGRSRSWSGRSTRVRARSCCARRRPTPRTASSRRPTPTSTGSGRA